MSSKHKILGTILAFSAALGVPGGVSASTSVGKIAMVSIRGTNFAVITIAPPPGDSRPNCHNGGFYDYAFDISTNKGRALLSTAQAAVLSGKQTTVVGGTTCTTIGSTQIETVQTLTLGSLF